ncbi:MAG: hypothetical protein ABJO36_05825 [Litorimonas sp.]
MTNSNTPTAEVSFSDLDPSKIIDPIVDSVNTVGNAVDKLLLDNALEELVTITSSLRNFVTQESAVISGAAAEIPGMVGTIFGVNLVAGEATGRGILSDLKALSNELTDASADFAADFGTSLPYLSSTAFLDSLFPSMNAMMGSLPPKILGALPGITIISAGIGTLSTGKVTLAHGPNGSTEVTGGVTGLIAHMKETLVPAKQAAMAAAYSRAAGAEPDTHLSDMAIGKITAASTAVVLDTLINLSNYVIELINTGLDAVPLEVKVDGGAAAGVLGSGGLTLLKIGAVVKFIVILVGDVIVQILQFLRSCCDLTQTVLDVEIAAHAKS